ncbi:hypothetical protein M422DRAFT_48082 [Sphaerobolus stellatus SS14]|uniref:Uncharacterized protein n=1 Tax=Sphaerobolus stellatus (strain SS14) TaxID=990650 RepID=A0A0C9VWX4_SPHS4|nr:hypothetical protein M422DRAFT_48082 [Sphaerobolus stellatus SS14]
MAPLPVRRSTSRTEAYFESAPTANKENNPPTNPPSKKKAMNRMSTGGKGRLTPSPAPRSASQTTAQFTAAASTQKAPPKRTCEHSDYDTNPEDELTPQAHGLTGANGQGDEAATGTDEEIDVLPCRRKKKKTDLDDPAAQLAIIQVNWGRILARVVDAFSNPKSMFSVGIKLENKAAEGHNVSEMYSEAWLRLSNSYQTFIGHQVEVDAYTSRVSDEPDKTLQQTDLQSFYENLTEGQDSSRNDDTGVIKSEVLDILRTEFTSADVEGLTKYKSSRGHTHHLTCRLLTPVGFDDTDEEKAKALESGKLPRDPEEMLMFLYHNYTCDIEDQMKGFLKSGLLSWKALYLGPSAWNGGGSRGKRSGKASLCNLMQVTGRTIAYVATLLHFALSDDETLDREVTAGKFSYSAFFWTLVTFFEDPDFEEEAEELLKWWNEEAFPKNKTATTEEEAAEDEPTSRLGRMKKQLLAKKAAALEAEANKQMTTKTSDCVTGADGDKSEDDEEEEVDEPTDGEQFGRS